MAHLTSCKAAVMSMALIGFAIAAACVSAADSAPASSAPLDGSKAQARTEAKLRQRIAALERHVRLLEARLETLAAGAATAAATPALAAPAAGATAVAATPASAATVIGASGAAAARTLAAPAAGASTVAATPTLAAPASANLRAEGPVATPPLQNTAPSAEHRAAPKSAAGAFDVDEDAAQRALERTLTQTGALLLAPRMITVTPNLTYTRRETAAAPILAAIPTAGGSVPVLLNTTNRRDEVTARLDLKAGLPLDSQFELSLPYTHVSQSLKTDLGAETTASGSGMGDLSVGVARTLLREKEWRPDLIGRLSYGAGNGKLQDGAVALGGGFRSVQAELVALKRQDPLAFVAGLTLSRSFEKDSVRPGDAAAFSLAALLAASPATSLQLGFTQTFLKEIEDNGVKRPGTKETFGMFNIGASSILARDIMLNALLGIGLGSDAPRYSFTFSLPVTF